MFPLLHEHQIPCVQGNYDNSVGHALNDCQCGYTDPRDNHFAQISYDYTLQNTSRENRAMLGICKKLGFAQRPDPDDLSTMLVSLDLDPEGDGS